MRRVVAEIALAAAFSALILCPAQAREVPTGKLPAGVTPTRYQLELEVTPAADRFSGQVRIDVKLDESTQMIWLHGRGLDAADAYALTSNGARVEATYTEVDDTGVARLETRRAIGSIGRINALFGKSIESPQVVNQPPTVASR